MDSYTNSSEETENYIAEEIDDILYSDGSSFYYDKSQENKKRKPNILVKIFSLLLLIITLLFVASIVSTVFIFTALTMIIGALFQLTRRVFKK